MGLGLAAPYAMLSVVPALGRVPPRPGRWMEVLRQALAFPMYGASAWLVWVISQEAGPSGVLGTAAGLVLLGFAAWVVGITQGAADRGRRIGQSAAAAALLAALAVLSGIAAAPAVAPGAAAEAGAEPFTPARLAALRAEGRPVFVNMTAAWCVTCLVNERVALGSEPVQRAFRQSPRGLSEGRLDAAGSADHRLSARERPRRRAAVCVLPAGRAARGAAADPDREHGAAGVGSRLTPCSQVALNGSPVHEG